MLTEHATWEEELGKQKVVSSKSLTQSGLRVETRFLRTKNQIPKYVRRILIIDSASLIPKSVKVEYADGQVDQAVFTKTEMTYIGQDVVAGLIEVKRQKDILQAQWQISRDPPAEIEFRS